MPRRRTRGRRTACCGTSSSPGCGPDHGDRGPAATGPDPQAATRAAYDAVAADYAARYATELAGQPLERAVLAGFAGLVRDGGGGPVADLGCGPGHVTAHLHALGLAVSGVDLSPGMVAQARRAHPGLRFEVGTMTALDLPDGALGGIVSWYSIVNLPTGQLPAVFAEFTRVLTPGGQLLLGFQAGDGHRHGTEWFGHPVALDLYLRPPDRVAQLLADAGLAVHARLVREPDPDAGERQPRASLLARLTRSAAGQAEQPAAGG